MATTTGYGLAAGLSRTETNTVQTAQKEDELGNITDLETYGGLNETTEEDYIAGAFTNAATNGQSGTTSSGVITENSVNEVNNDFARETTKTVTPLAAGAEIMANDWHTYEDESEIIDLIPESVTITDRAGVDTVYPMKDDNGLVVKHLPVRVPLSYCKVREYNSAQETLSAMGIPWKIDGIEIKPPVLGAFTLMELTNNPFPVNFSETTTIQKFHALFFNEYRDQAANLVRDWHCRENEIEFDPKDKSTWTDLDRAAEKYIDGLIDRGIDMMSLETWDKIVDYFSSSWNGFEMIPGGGSSKYWFCSETIGSIVSGLMADLNCSYQQVLWEIPISTIGFAMVGKQKQNGTKGVHRPYCRADQRRQRILAYLRELHGELHQWQIDKPLKSVLTDEQSKHNSAVKELERLREEAGK